MEAENIEMEKQSAEKDIVKDESDTWSMQVEVGSIDGEDRRDNKWKRLFSLILVFVLFLTLATLSVYISFDQFDYLNIAKPCMNSTLNNTLLLWCA